jgi:PAS domain S-box-containing protein
MDAGTGTKVTHILLLEDDKAHQELILRMFRDDPEQFRISIAGTVRDAREIIGREHPDLIIADWILPDGKGIEILPRTDDLVTTPLIIMTSFGDEHLAVEIMKSGAIDYVVKSATVFKDMPHIARRALHDWNNITERKRAEQAKGNSEKRLADIISFLPDAVIAIDNEGRVIAWNEATEQMTGVAAEEMLGKGDFEYSIPFYGERRPILIDLIRMEDTEIEKKYLNLKREGERTSSEVYIPTLFGGKGAYLWGTASPLYDSTGNRIGAIEIIRDITTQKQAQEELRESELRYRSVIENAAEGITVVQDGKLQYANTRLLEMTQVSPKEITNRPFTDFIHPDDRALVFERYQHRISGEDVPPYYDFRVIGKNGTVIWVQISAVRIIWNGKPATLNFLTDITERKQSEEALRTTHEWLGISLRAAHAGIWDWDVPTGVLTWSTEFFELFGFPPDAKTSFETWLAALHPDYREEAQAKIEQSIRDHTALWNEYQIILPGGQERWVGAAGSTTYNDAGEPLRMSGVCIDITDRKVAEEKLRESEERYQSLFNRSLDLIYIHDLEGNFLDANASALDLLGYSKEEIPQVSFQNLVGPDELQKAKAATETIVKEGSHSGLIEYRLKLKNGGFVDVETKGTLVAHDGKPYAIFGIARDITCRNQAEQIRKSYEARLNSAMEIGSLAWWEMDLPDGTIRFDDRKATMLGYSPEKFHHYRDFTALLHPDDYEAAMQAMRNHIEGGESRYHTDYRILNAAGDYLWFRDVGGITRRHTDGSPATVTGIVIDITASKLAEEALSATDARFRAIIQNSSDVIRILDRKGMVVYESVSSERILGYPPGSIIGRDPFEYVHPDDIERVKNDLSEVYEKKNNGIPTEFRIRKADGEYLWVDSIGSNLLDVAGVNGIVITTRSIQQRKQAEEQINKTLHQLERSEALLRKVYDILPIGLWLADKNGKLLFGNPAGVKIWGAEPLVPLEEYGVFKARRYPSGEEIAPDDWALSHTILEGVTIKDEMIEIDAFDGKKKIILNYTAPLYDAAGTLDGAIVVNQEITGKVLAEQALTDNQARLSTAMDIAGLVNWEYDVASGMFTFDDRFYAFFETTADREGGNLMSADTYMQEFVYPEDRPKVLAEIQKLLATTDPAYSGQMEHRITPRDGSIRTIIARYATVMGPDGKVIRTYGANQDITDRKLMESEICSLNVVLEQRVKDRTEALVETNEKLEEENVQRLETEKKLQASYDEKVMLLKEIHHRVKNNLQIIASLLNLQSRYIKDESTLAAIRESQNRVKAMALVHEKLYRSEDISHISLQDYIKFLGTGLFQFYDAKLRGIRFNLDIHDIEVDIDTAIPLGLIINELISNSLKYAFPEGKTGEVVISVSKEGRTLTVLFRDTGIGIPADLDWRNTPSLGLRLVITLIDQMNGTIELDRSAGTLFTMVVHEKEPRSEK